MSAPTCRASQTVDGVATNDGCLPELGASLPSGKAFVHPCEQGRPSQQFAMQCIPSRLVGSPPTCILPILFGTNLVRRAQQPPSPRRGRVRVGVHAGAAAMSSFPPSRPSPARGEGAHAPGDGPPCPIGGDTHRSPSAHRTAVFRLLQAQLPVRPHAAYQRCGPPRPHGSPAADTT
jgi:hypothetical protein